MTRMIDSAVIVGLLVAAGVMGVLAVAQLSDPAEPPVAGLPLSGTSSVTSQMEAPDLPSDRGGDPTQYRAWSEKPLFEARRRPPEPEDDPKDTIVESLPEALPKELRLTAVVVIAGDRIAVIAKADGDRSRQVRVGDKVKTWSVTRIDETQVELARNGSVASLKLFARPNERADKQPANQSDADGTVETDNATKPETEAATGTLSSPQAPQPLTPNPVLPSPGDRRAALDVLRVGHG